MIINVLEVYSMLFTNKFSSRETIVLGNNIKISIVYSWHEFRIVQKRKFPTTRFSNLFVNAIFRLSLWQQWASLFLPPVQKLFGKWQEVEMWYNYVHIEYSKLDIFIMIKLTHRVQRWKSKQKTIVRTTTIQRRMSTC